MVAHRAGALKVAVVAMAMLVAIGSWEVYRGAEALAAQELLFKCYTLSQTGGAVGERVDLINNEQFADELNVQVGDPQLLCVPITKQRGEETTDPQVSEDILCYKISPSTSVNETVTLTDQFRTDGQTARVTSAELLCVEVTKN
jgi:hypothetical protein